jgi:hypothetical protein
MSLLIRQCVDADPSDFTAMPCGINRLWSQHFLCRWAMQLRVRDSRRVAEGSQPLEAVVALGVASVTLSSDVTKNAGPVVQWN